MVFATRKTGKVAAAGFVFMAVSGLETFGTVIEFSQDGSKTVFESNPDKSSQKQTINVSFSKSSSELRLRELAREVATRHSGTVGVKAAKLDALTFVNLFEALIEAESSFDPLAVSEKGAQGLGQLMPETAEELGVANPFDPAQNLEGAARYLTQLLQRFASVELALAAYNAGPGRVDQHKGVPPFAETRTYVAKLLNEIGLSNASMKSSISASSNAVATDASVALDESTSSTPMAKASRQRVTPVSDKQISEHPLKGEISVWEF